MRKNQRMQRRKIRTRSKINGTAKRPRLCVFRSTKYIYAQLIDDEKQKTIIGVSEKQLVKEKDAKRIKTSKALALGELLAKEAQKKKIKAVVFDKGSYKYHGRVKAVAEGARKGGLQF